MTSNAQSHRNESVYFTWYSHGFRETLQQSVVVNRVRVVDFFHQGRFALVLNFFRRRRFRRRFFKSSWCRRRLLFLRRCFRRLVLLSRSFSSRRRRRRRLLRLHPSFLSFYFLLFLRQRSASFLVPSLWQRRQTVLHPTLLHVTPQLSLKRPRLFQPFLFLFPAHAFSLPRVFHHSLARLSYHPRDLPNTLFVRPQRLLAPFLRQPFLSYPFQILD